MPKIKAAVRRVATSGRNGSARDDSTASVECHFVLVVGLTGGIGSGKSTVAGLLAERGAAIVDADAVAREVVEPGMPAHAEIVERFGKDVLNDDGTIDRQRLADIIFADEQARLDLNSITHPRIGEEFMRRVATAVEGGAAIIVCDVPLLAEAQARMYGTVIVVEAPEETRLERLVIRGVARGDARARMATQASDEERRAIADFVVDNQGSVEELTPQVDQLWVELLGKAESV